MADRQLDLFDFANPQEEALQNGTDLFDAIRLDGRAPLAAVPAQDGQTAGGAGETGRGALRGPGDDHRGDGHVEATATEGAIPDAIAGPDAGLGIDPEKYILLEPELGVAL
jgi:hypothetical protein